jgi:hypothetical protein
MVEDIEAKGRDMLFRIYGPLQPWFDKTWHPADRVGEVVKWFQSSGVRGIMELGEIL